MGQMASRRDFGRAGQSAWGPGGPIGRARPRGNYFCRAKPRKRLKRLIPNERIQGNPNRKSALPKSLSRPLRGSPTTSKRRICLGSEAANFSPHSPCNPLKTNDRRRFMAENGGKRRPLKPRIPCFGAPENSREPAESRRRPASRRKINSRRRGGSGLSPPVPRARTVFRGRGRRGRAGRRAGSRRGYIPSYRGRAGRGGASPPRPQAPAR
jgi:hypothetical protein